MRVCAFDIDGGEAQVVYLESQQRLQLWYRMTAWKGRDPMPWDFGHAKSLPEGMRPIDGALYMAKWVRGELDREEYNKLLPAN